MGKWWGKKKAGVVGEGDAEMSVYFYLCLLLIWYFLATDSPFHACFGLLDRVETALLYLPSTTFSPLAFSVLGIVHDVFQGHHEDILPGLLNLAFPHPLSPSWGFMIPGTYCLHNHKERGLDFWGGQWPKIWGRLHWAWKIWCKESHRIRTCKSGEYFEEWVKCESHCGAAEGQEGRSGHWDQ